uniref:Uncharacterized protein n=1 Tax=Rhizophora mucronata TaxID=61149 RepID=A0A2P2QZ47_RHIMU
MPGTINYLVLLTHLNLRPHSLHTWG